MEIVALTLAILAFLFACLSLAGTAGLGIYLFVFKPAPTTINVNSSSGDQVDVAHTESRHCWSFAGWAGESAIG